MRAPGKAAAREQGSMRRGAAVRVSLQALISEGVLKAPSELSATYRGHALTATVTEDGALIYGGRRFTSPSKAAGVARKAFYKGSLGFPATNGWVFWKIKDPITQEMIPLGGLRGRLLEKRKGQADRFVRKDA